MISLRRLEENDLVDTLEWRNSPENNDKFLTTGEISLEDHLKWFDCIKTDDTQAVLAVLLDGKLIGQISFYNWVKTKKTADVGRFLIAKEYQGRGYFLMAYKMMEKLMIERKIKTINIEAMSANTRALQIYNKMGFTMGNCNGPVIKGYKNIK
ncbi:GNAT family N-acetyltransferase [Planktomarina sp.]|nr:GNAT family N-acetyltransferase [Planktomarina sp.]